MIQKTAGRGAPIPVVALIAAIILLLIQASAASAAPKVTVRLRTSATLGLVAGWNDTLTLAATVKTSDGSTPGVTWKSSAPLVASVDALGRLTAHKKGVTVIRATAGGVTARCVVSVKSLPVRALTLNRTRITLYVGRSGFQLTATPKPVNADNPAVAWSSTRTSVASVDRATGYVTPVKAGITVIRCRATDGNQKKSTCTVVVKPVVPTGLALSSATLEVNVGATATLSATVSPADATDKRIVWTSNNPNVATVAGGVVTGKQYGKATITARTRSGSVRARCVAYVGYYTTEFRALIVGQDAYDFGELGAPATDVRLVKSMLMNSDFGSGKSVNVTLKENLTTAALRGALNQMASWGVDGDDVTYFYYSGHGSESVPGALVGVDGGVISVDEVRGYLDRLPGTVVVILDSCYSGWFIRSKSAGASSAAAVNPDTVNERVVSAFSKASSGGITAKTSLTGSKTAAGSYKILTACSSTESSYIISSASFQGASLFTYYLASGGGVNAKNWEAARLYADVNSNNIVTLNELYKYTRPRVLSNPSLVRAGVKQSVRIWPEGSSFPVLQRTP